RPAVASGKVSAVPTPAAAADRLPQVARSAAPAGGGAASIRSQIDSMIASKGGPNAPATGDHGRAVAAFVCEDDVRQAIALGRKIVVGERTIVTPSARDLAEPNRVFVTASWRP